MSTLHFTHSADASFGDRRREPHAASLL